MRIETEAFGRPSVRSYTPPAKEDEFGYAGSKMRHQPMGVLTARKELFKCPKCIGGVVKEEVDDFQLVLRCLNCGWNKCSLEPEEKKIKGEGIYGNNYKRY